MLEGIRVLGREGDALADIFPSTHRTSFFGLNINTVPWGTAAFLLLQDVAPRRGIVWGQTGANPSRGCLKRAEGQLHGWHLVYRLKSRLKKRKGTSPSFFPDFLMKPVWIGFYSVKVTLVRWGQRSGIGSERFRGCVLAPTVPSLTHSLITALEEMWQVSTHTTTNDGATRVINIRTNTLNVVIYKYRGTGSYNTLWTE